MGNGTQRTTESADLGSGLENPGQFGARPANASTEQQLAAQEMRPAHQRAVIAEHGVRNAALALQEEIQRTLRHRVFLMEDEVKELIQLLGGYDDPAAARWATQLQMILDRPEDFEPR